jgi:diguanylate cyclase (GGDEF)-like protein/hemerythrin-like metal-binding protein
MRPLMPAAQGLQLAYTLLGVGLSLGFLIGYLLTRLRLTLKIEQQRRSLASVESANAGLQAVLDSLETAAGTDRLTGAWNRRRFEEAASAEMALAWRRKEPLSLLMLDLDHFKRINDGFGHEAGDTVLAGVASAWKELLRTSDPLVRWGGEEFLVLLPINRLDGALVTANKLLEATRTLRFPGIGPITVSIGVAEFAPGESLESWIQRSDQALSRAKAEGRDRVVAADGPAVDTLELGPIIELLWEDAFACGHPTIDMQHRNIYDLGNALLAALTLGLPKEDVLLRWNRLVAHTAQHFNDEERILAAAPFPDLAHHAEEHQRLLELAKGLQASFLAGNADLGRVVNFLAVDLVKGHLLHEDSNYFKDLNLKPRTR